MDLSAPKARSIEQTEVAKLKQLYSVLHHLPKGKSTQTQYPSTTWEPGSMAQAHVTACVPESDCGLQGLNQSTHPTNLSINWDIQRIFCLFHVQSDIIRCVPMWETGSSEELEIFAGLSILSPPMSTLSPPFWGLVARIMERAEVSIASPPSSIISRKGLCPWSSLFFTQLKGLDRGWGMAWDGNV